MGDVTQFPGGKKGGKKGGGPGRPPTGNSGDRLISMNALSQLIGVSRDTIERWAKFEGCPTVTHPRDGNGKGWTFDVAAVFEWRMDAVRKEAVRQVTSTISDGGEILDFDERFKRGRAIEKELNVGILQDSLVFDVDVAKERDREIGRFGQEANSIAAKAARDINPKDQARIQQIIQRYVDAMMTRLVEGEDDDDDGE